MQDSNLLDYRAITLDYRAIALDYWSDLGGGAGDVEAGGVGAEGGEVGDRVISEFILSSDCGAGEVEGGGVDGRSGVRHGGAGAGDFIDLVEEALSLLGRGLW